MTAPTALDTVIPAYNARATIGGCVRSAFAAGSGRVIVVDDGSTDDTVQLARQAGAEVLTQPNQGAAVARRNGAAVATGEYLVFLDSDDELIPPGVARSIDLLARNSTLAVVGGSILERWPNGSLRPHRTAPGELTSQGLLERGFGPWPPAAAVVRRYAYLAAEHREPRPLRPPLTEDFELLIRLSMTGGVGRHDEPSAVYRIYAGKSNRSPIASLRQAERIRAYYADHLGLSVTPHSDRQLRAASLARRGKIARAHGQPVRAAGLFLGSAATRPAGLLGKLVAAR